VVAIRAQAGALAGAAWVEYIRGHWPGQEVYRLAHEHGLEIHVSRYQPRSTLAPTLRTFAAEPRARAGPTGTPPTAPP
jgi:hypothetical protein